MGEKGRAEGLASLGLGEAGEGKVEGEQPTEITLDVRGLQPSRSMIRTLQALEDLPQGRSLIQVNEQIPAFPHPELKSRVFRRTILDETPGQVRVRIERD